MGLRAEVLHGAGHQAGAAAGAPRGVSDLGASLQIRASNSSDLRAPEGPISLGTWRGWGTQDDAMPSHHRHVGPVTIISALSGLELGVLVALPAGDPAVPSVC